METLIKLFEHKSNLEPMRCSVTLPDKQPNFNLWTNWLHRVCRKIEIDAELYVDKRVQQTNRETIANYLNSIQ